MTKWFAVLVASVYLLVAAFAMKHARGATWPSQDVLAKCSVYLPAVRDAKLRRYCLKLSKRMP